MTGYGQLLKLKKQYIIEREGVYVQKCKVEGVRARRGIKVSGRGKEIKESGKVR